MGWIPDKIPVQVVHVEKGFLATSNLAERQYRDKYGLDANEEMPAAMSTGYAPWFIVPAD